MSCRGENSDPNSRPGDAVPCDSTQQSCPVPPCNRATILRPIGSLDASTNPTNSWLSSPCFHFDFQGVVSGSAGPYVLDFNGEIDPAAHYSPNWTLDAAAGTLANGTSLQPTHSAPTAAGEGNVTLQGMHGGSAAGCTDRKRIKIYRDHLARDFENFGTGISCGNPLGVSTWTFTRFGATISMPGSWNCHGGTRHLNNGGGNGSTGLSGVSYLFDPSRLKATVTVTHTLTGGGSHPPLGSLSRGDIVVCFTDAGELGELLDQLVERVGHGGLRSGR